MKELRHNYVFDEKTHLIGEGAFGKVFQTTNKFDDSIKVAIKVLDKVKIDDMECIINEVKILNKLDHPNICKYFETYDDK